jgi:uncharacterized protein YkwD
MTSGRAGFRALLVVGLVWSAYPTIAGAASSTTTNEPGASTTAEGSPPATTPRTSSAVITVPSTTTSAPTTNPPATIPPATDPPATSPPPPPPTAATEPTVANSTTPAPPPPARAPAASPTASSALCDGPGSALLDATNADRTANGLSTLCANAQLTGFAQDWANQMAQNHSLTHRDLSTVAHATPFHHLGENILQCLCTMSAAYIESTFLASPEHRDNILDGAFIAVGIGIAYSTNGQLWVAIDYGGSV